MPIALALMLLTGCGGDAEDEPLRTPRESPAAAQQVCAVVDGYFDAYVRADATRACRFVGSAGKVDMLSRNEASECAIAIDVAVDLTPREVRRELDPAPIGRVTVTGDRATVTLRRTPYSQRSGGPQSIELTRKGGKWEISALPPEYSGELSEMTSCMSFGVEEFEKRRVEPFWRREGRSVYVEFLRRVCDRAERAGVLAKKGGRGAVQRIRARVLDEMVESGRIEVGGS